MIKGPVSKLATSIAVAWRRLERRLRAEADQHRLVLRKAQRARRAAFVAALKCHGFTKPQQAKVLRFLELDIIDGRERRDLEDEMQRARRQAAEADSKQMMVSWEEWQQLEPSRPPTREELLRLLADDDDLAMLASASTVAELQRIRRQGSKQQKQQLANAIAGIRRGRPKRDDDPRQMQRMRRKKTEVQGALLRARRAMKRTGQVDANAYKRRIERDVLVPLGWPSEKRLRILSLISDPGMKPVDAASVIVGAEFHIRPSVVRRLGRVVLERQKRDTRGRPAQKSDRKRVRDPFIA